MAAILARHGHTVALWGNNTAHLRECAAIHENRLYLPGIKLPDTIKYVEAAKDAVAGASLVLVAIPTRYIRTAMAGLSLSTGPRPDAVLSLTKGIEQHSLRFPSEIVQEETGFPGTVGVLSGPTMALEIAQHHPASITLAHPNAKLAEQLQGELATSTFRVYLSTDRLGVELAGAVKNVIAIAAGVADGMGLGDNAKAALLTRGLTELRRLGRTLGAVDETFMGLAGVGDLYTTCASPLGRNRGFGERLGRGMSPLEAQKDMGGKAVEGYDTAVSIHELAIKHRVEMPISAAVYKVIHLGWTPMAALRELLARDLRAEEDPDGLIP
jgi:glycerol-3-phosphate dehydrogenase (NAD(P)+)